MKKSVCIGLCLAFIFTLSTASLAEELTIVGTGSGVAILKSVGKAFVQKYPDHSVSVPRSIGSGGGIKAVGNDEYKLGRVARPIKEKESHFGLSYLPVARMPIVFFTHPGVGVDNLSVQQVLDIYSGKMTNWKEAGGPDVKIRVIRREDGDSSLSVLQKSFPGFADITLTPKSKTVFSDGETLSLVEKKQNTIAFGTYGNASTHQVRIVRIDNVPPTDKAYPYYGTLSLIFKDKNKTGTVAEFLNFAVSPEGVEAIKSAGGFPFQ